MVIHTKSDGRIRIEFKKENAMENAGKKNIILFAPKSNIATAIGTGLIGVLAGLALLYFARGQLLMLGFSILIIIGGLWLGSYFTWKLIRKPVLIIDAEGILSQSQLLRWEEMDAIYRINTRKGGVFAVDISPAGLVTLTARQSKRLPGSRNLEGPQLALGVTAASLPIPVNELLALVRERFSEQIERYHINCPMY
jgi:hypothetical protein